MPPFIFYLLTLAIFAAIYGILVLGLNIQWGYTGVLNFMYIIFVAIGGYVTMILVLPKADPSLGESYILGLNWPFLPALFVGGLIASLFAWLVGLITLHRLRSDYFAIVTVAIGLIIWTIVGNVTPLVNGWDGLAGVPLPFADVLKLDLNTYGFFFLGLCLLVLLLTYMFSERVYNSPFGRTLRSVRENEFIAQSLGKNVFVLRLQAFAIGAFIAGIGGGLLVTYVGAFNPSGWTSAETFLLWAALLLGGSANNRGAMLGAIMVPVIFTEGTRFLPSYSNSPQLIDSVRYIVVGVLLILIMRFRPQGILSERRNILSDEKVTPPAVAVTLEARGSMRDVVGRDRMSENLLLEGEEPNDGQ